MPYLYLTPASISYLNQLLLSLVIAVYLGWRFFPRKNYLPSKQDLLLVIFFVTAAVFSLTLFLDVSFLPTDRLLVVYSQNTILGLLLVSLIQFAYNFPASKESQKIERRLALLVTCLYTLCELGVALWRYSLLWQGQVEFRPDYLDYVPVIEFLWAVFVFARGAIQNWRVSASRYFALIFLIPFYLAALNLLRTFYYVSASFLHNSLSVGILLTIFLFALNYLASKPETTYLMTKISGAVLASVLAVFGVVGWLVTPEYAAHYSPALIDHRTIHFAPNAQGGYEVTEIPFHFESDLGQNLGLTDSPVQPSALITDFTFPFYGRVYRELFISNNGIVTFEGPSDYKDLEYRFSNLPAIFVTMLDLYPEVSTDGGIFLRRETEKLVITFNRLKAYYHPEQIYTSQLTLYANGSFEITLNGLPNDQLYYVNDRPDAALWVMGAKPARAPEQAVGFSHLPLQSGAEGILQDEYRAFRQFLHNFLLPLAGAILISSLLFLVGLPLVLTYNLTRPLTSLLTGVAQINRGQRELHIPVQFNDEVGFLTQSFNEMAGELDSLIKNLEVRVTERTTDLLTANEQLRKLSIAVEQSPSTIIITDLEANIQYVNPAFTSSTGYRLVEVVGQNPRLLKSNLTSSKTYEEMWAALMAGKVWRGELTNRKKTGEVFCEFTVIAPIYDEGSMVTHYVAVKEDITARKRAEDALRESEKHYRDLFDLESDAIFIIRNRDGAILEANNAATLLYGFSYEELLHKLNTDLSAEPEATQNATHSPLPADQVIAIPRRWHRKKDGTVFPVEITARFITWKDEEVHLAAIRDVTERHRAEEELERLAVTDPLTNLFNRRYFFGEAEKIFARSKHEPFELGAFMLDVDFFKKINDTYGHQTGDVVLSEVARRIRDSLRPTDLLGRYGGEEFVALLPRTKSSEIEPIATRLLNSIRGLPIISSSGIDISVTVSLGVANLDADVETLDELLSRADQALYKAKQSGRNRWAIWEERLA